MADIVEKVLEQNLLQAAKAVEDQIDAEIQKLENMDDEEMETLYQKRLDAMKKQMKQKAEWLEMGHGEHMELANEKEFFDACKKSPNFICHFYRDSTFRCKIVDKHLSILAKKHLETCFRKLNVEKAPFLTDRLNIRVLPTIALCKNSSTKDFIIGFDDLGGIDEFSTEMMEWRIARAGVINYSGDLMQPPGAAPAKKSSKVLGYKTTKTIRGKTADTDSDED